MPSKFPCPDKIDCGCLDSPVRNLSSEEIDFPGNFCLHFGQQIPNMGVEFGDVTCLAVGESLVSQEDACLQAAVNSLFCTVKEWVPPILPPPPPPPPIEPPPGYFGNEEQTACELCASVLESCYTVVANSFIAPTQEEANDIALEFAKAYAALLAATNSNCDPETPPNPQPIIYLSHEAQCDALCPDGLSFTYIVRAGAFAALNQVLADRMAYSYACRQAALHRVCLSALSDPSVCLGSESSVTITASGALLAGTTNFWLVTSGAVPVGMVFSPSGFGGRVATISGTPTAAGDYTFTVRVTTSSGDFMVKTYSLCVVEMQPTVLPNGTPNVAYLQDLNTNCGSASAWFLSSGSLPPGITLDSENGTLSGTPTTAGTYNFTITVQT